MTINEIMCFSGILIGIVCILVISSLMDGLENVLRAKIAHRVLPSIWVPMYERVSLLTVAEPPLNGKEMWFFLSMPVLAVTFIILFFINLLTPFIHACNGGGDVISMIFLLVLGIGCMAIGCYSSRSTRASIAGDYELVQLLSISTYFALLFCSLAWFMLQRGVAGELFSPSVYIKYSLWDFAHSAGRIGLVFFILSFLVIVPVQGKQGVPYPGVGDYRGIGMAFMSMAVSLRLTALYALIALVFFHTDTLAMASTNRFAILVTLIYLAIKVFFIRFIGNILAKVFAWISPGLHSALSSYFIMLLLSVVGILLLALDVLSGKSLGIG